MIRPLLVVAGSLLVALPSMAAVHSHHHTTSHALVRHSLSPHARHSTVEHAPVPSMSSERATEIQTALIQHGYMSGEATGTWDAASYAAMQKMQSDNGWQTKLVPDSRALIKLGLGPNSSAPANADPVPSESPSFN